MALITEPALAVFPIFTQPKNLPAGRIGDFCGTGFFVAEDGTFVTARHVVELAIEDTSIDLVGVSLDLSKFQLFDIRWPIPQDLAIGKADYGKETLYLSIATADPGLNLDVLAYEYSGTTSRLRPNGIREVEVRPYTRKGNVVAIYEEELSGVPTRVLELSFPALKGASGAPVMLGQSGDVVGVLLANLERHLMPAQVERIIIKRDQVTETRYFLPSGIGISWRYISELMS